MLALLPFSFSLTFFLRGNRLALPAFCPLDTRQAHNRRLMTRVKGGAIHLIAPHKGIVAGLKLIERWRLALHHHAWHHARRSVERAGIGYSYLLVQEMGIVPIRETSRLACCERDTHSEP